MTDFAQTQPGAASPGAPVEVDLTVDLIFTWQHTLSVLLALLDSASSEGKRFARVELHRMAAAADLGGESLKLLAHLVETDECKCEPVMALLTKASIVAMSAGQGDEASNRSGTILPAPAPVAKFGLLAKQSGKQLPLEVCYSACGWYIGTTLEDMPYSRESIEYWPKRELATNALETGTWTQKQNP